MQMRKLLKEQDKINRQMQARLRIALLGELDTGFKRSAIKRQIKENIPEQLVKKSVNLGMKWLKT